MHIWILRGNVIEIVTSADSLARAEALLGPLFPGCEMLAEPDGVNGVAGATWQDGVLTPPPLPASRRTVTVSEFRDRFTDAEMDAVLTLAYSGDAIARKLLLKIQTASEGVNLEAAEVAAGLGYLVSRGVIAAPRVDEILA